MATPAYLQPQSVTIPFRAGLDKKTSDKAVNPPQLLAAENCSFDTPGEIKKDRPYQPTGALPNDIFGLTIPSPIYRAFGVGVRRSFLAKFSLYDVRDSGKSSRVNNFSDGFGPIIGDGLCASTSAEPLSELPSNRSTTLYDVDYAYANGFELIVRSDFAATFDFAIRERETKAILYHLNGTAIFAGSHARAVAVGTWLVVAWQTAAQLKIVKIDTSALPSSITITVLNANAVGAYHALDVAADPTSGAVWIVQHDNAAGIRLTKHVLATGVNSTLATGAVPTSGLSIGVSSDGLRAMVAWCNNATGMNVQTFTSGVGLGITNVAATVENAAATIVVRSGICDAADGLGFYLVYENTTAAPTLVTRVYVLNSTAVAGTRQVIYDYQLAHKPFVRDSIVYFGIGFTEGFLASNTQNYYATVAWNPSSSATQCAPIAWYLSGIACVRQNANMLANMSLDGNALEYRWLGTERAQIGKQDASGTDYAALLSLQSIRFNDGNGVPLYDTFVVPGNALRDREGFIDVAFQFAPTIQSIAYAGGGALVAGQTYEWIAIYESVDSYGNVQRSRPSVPVSGTVTPGNSKATLTISAPFTRFGNQVSIVVYRSLAGLGAPHYRSTEQLIAHSGGRSGFASYALVDIAADTSISTYQRLYTDSNILPSYPPPMGRCWAIHQNRIWSIDEHSRELRYTRTLVSGEGPAWHPNLTVPLATDRIDGKALVSSPSGLWVLGLDKNTGAGAIAIVLGTGPGDDGNGATYEVQRLEGNNAGVSSANAVVSTPNGIMFEDSKLGIHLLPSSGGIPQPIGLPVESLRTGKTLVRPVLLQDRHEVRFVYSTGFMLVFDYVVNQWFSRQMVGATFAIVDSCVWDGVHVVLDSTLGPLTQVASGKDALSGASGTYIPTKITTGWIRLADFEGLQCVWDIYVLGTAYDFLGLAISISYDFDDSVVDTHTWVDTNLPSSGPLELRVPLRKETMTAFKLSVLDSQSASGTTHLGYGLVAIRVDYGVFGRSRHVAPARMAG